MSCGVGCKLILDLVLLWLWCRSAATAPIRHLAWELPYAVCVALKRQKKKKKEKKKEKKKKNILNRKRKEQGFTQGKEGVL